MSGEIAHAEPPEAVLEAETEFEPSKAIWIVTDNCNLDCNYCYVRHTTDNYGFEHRKAIVNELRTYDFDSIALTGGEALLYWDQLERLLPLIEDASLSVDTNSAFITEEVATELATYDDMAVNISLNGACSDVHDVSRGEGAFEDVVEAAETLREHGLEFGFGTTILPSNKDHVEALCQFAYDVGARSIGFHGYLPTFDMEGQYEQLLTPGEYHEVATDIKACYDEWDGDLNVHAGGTLPFTFLLDDEIRECYLELGDEFTVCSLGRKVNVTPAGDVVPCLYLREPMGNILDEDLHDIMNTEQARAYRWIADTGQRDGTCGSCAYSDACGGCPVAELALEGSLTAGDPRCWIGSSS